MRVRGCAGARLTRAQVMMGSQDGYYGFGMVAFTAVLGMAADEAAAVCEAAVAASRDTSQHVYTVLWVPPGPVGDDADHAQPCCLWTQAAGCVERRGMGWDVDLVVCLTIFNLFWNAHGLIVTRSRRHLGGSLQP